MQIVEFVSRGRLSYEKWSDILIHALSRLLSTSECPNFHIHIFGDGVYQSDFLSLSKQYPQHITYYGRSTQATIFETARRCHYTLMPSRFLETFGLTALESLSLGLPVIGYAKWGVEPFVMKSFRLAEYETLQTLGDSLWNMIIWLIRDFDNEQRNKDSAQAQHIAATYSDTVRLKEFENIYTIDN